MGQLKAGAPFAVFATLLASLFLCAPLRADVGVGFSSLFTVDTRYGFSERSGTSGLFILDTRLSGSWASAQSGNFTLDTRGAMVGSASISGYVMTSSSAPLGSVTVQALQSGIVRASASTDGNGYYQLPLLPAGTYDLRAVKADWLTGIRFGIALGQNQAIYQHFALEPRPPPPVVQTTTRDAEPEQTPIRHIPTSDQLKRWVNGQFLSGQPLDPNKMTIVLTHGWTGSTDPNNWPTEMAMNLVDGGIAPELNIVAWDWREDAAQALPLAAQRTHRQGEALGLSLYTSLDGESYSRPIHFIGFSMGTLVNAAAANLLHNDTNVRLPKHWLPGRTHITILDDAEITTVLAQASHPVSAIPQRSGWVDNYYTIVGAYRSTADVNVFLFKGYFHFNLEEWHYYARKWYSRTILNPNSAIMGHRFSFERMGEQPYFPRGLLLRQDPSPFQSEMELIVPATVAEVYEHSKAFASRVYQGTVNVVQGTVQAVGNVTTTVKETVVETFQNIGSSVLNAFSVSFNLRTAPADAAQRAARGDDSESNSPAYVWLPVDVPADAVTLAFDFALEGDGADDFVAAGINGTNVFALETRFIAENTTLNSGPIDVSQYAGETVELFFGIMGGTSTNASLTVEGIRFYTVMPPALTIAALPGQSVLSWPMWATNYVLETTTALEQEEWASVVGEPALVGFEHTVTNVTDSAKRFYRLIAP